MIIDKSHTTQPTAVQVAYPVGRGDRTHHVYYTKNGVANNDVSVPLSHLDVAAWPTGEDAACCRCVPRFRIRNPKDRHPKPGTRLVPQKREKRSQILHPPRDGPERTAEGSISPSIRTLQTEQVRREYKQSMRGQTNNANKNDN
jgi:hypothetical protein